MKKDKIYYCKKCHKNKVNWSRYLYGRGFCRHCGQLGLKRKGLNGKTNPNYKDGKTLKFYKCQCGKLINTKQYLYKEGRKCKSCCKLGENNNNWCGGISKFPYSFLFTITLKQKIHKRDNNKCILCNITKNQHLLIYNKCISVHHIDYNKTNCKEDNLVSLCLKCNSKVNYNRDYWYAYFTYIMENCHEF